MVDSATLWAFESWGGDKHDSTGNEMMKMSKVGLVYSTEGG